MKFLKSISAWFAGLFKKGTVMTDETQAVAAEVQPAASPAPVDPIPVLVEQVVVQPAPVLAPEPAKPTASALIAKLEAALTAMGHELPVFWDEAVALAKKAL